MIRRQNEFFSTAIADNHGKFLTEDPQTGRKFEVPMDSSYYWRSRSGANAGRFASTETDNLPILRDEWFDKMSMPKNRTVPKKNNFLSIRRNGEAGSLEKDDRFPEWESFLAPQILRDIFIFL